VRSARALFIVAAAALPLCGCVLALPVGAVASRSIEPELAPAPLSIDSVPLGAQIRWRIAGDKSRAFASSTLKAASAREWTVARRRSGDTVLSVTSLAELQAVHGTTQSRSRALWQPFLWGTIGYTAGALAGQLLAPDKASGDLTESGLIGAIIGGLGGTVYGTRRGLRPVPRWVPVATSAR